MLHILWLILKGILILIGIIIGLILLGVLLLLFCPVRYRGKIKKERTEGIRETQAFGQVSWLFHGVSVKALWNHGSLKTEICILGIPLSRLKSLFQRRNKKNSSKQKKSQKQIKEPEFRKEEKKTEPPVIIKEESIPPEELEERREEKNVPVLQEEERAEIPEEVWEYDTSDSPEELYQIPESDEINEEEERLRKGIAGLFFEIVEKIRATARKLGGMLRRIIEIPGKIRKKIQNFALTIRKFCDKINGWKDFINHPRTRAAISLVWKDAKKLLHHVLPTRITGKVIFGCEDPAITGTVLAVLGMTIPFHRNKVAVTPLFNEGNILEGEIVLKGRVYGVILLKTAVELYFNKNVKYVIHRWRHKEVNHGERE